MDIWIVWGTWVTAIGTVLLAAVGVWAAITGVSTLKQSKTDSIARSRPYVYASLVTGLAGVSTYDLLIKNAGQSIARDITFSCPDIPDNPDDFAAGVRDVFTRKITLPPQTSIRIYWRMELTQGSYWSDGSTDPVGMPSLATLNIKYSGDIEKGKIYEATERLDTGIFKMAPVPSAGTNARASFTPVEKDLHNMLGLIAQSVRELGR